ncbi:hypothetical protein BGZ96_011088 [Linnemannia gamsii]|uniref:Ubiquitin-like domain-containing protein n=1 Tax=Linnemannia gamsii TaxID=64522 RepID=A0ABQ7KC98_9FUNG|nr:hypothetical protein BGZ96_011088 [Linnemannia gamsii]
MSSVEESLFISQFLAAYGSQETKFPSTYVPSGLAPSWTSKRATFERPAKPVKGDIAEGDVEVTVKALKTGEWTVTVAAQGTIANLKEALQAKSGIEAGAQRLVLKGKALVDNKPLSEYGIITGSVVHLFAKAGATLTPTTAISSASASLAPTPASESTPAVTAETAAGGASPAAAAAKAPQTTKPAVTSYRGLSEAGTEIVKDAEFWYWLNEQLKERLGSKEDASLMIKGFIGQYRDLIGNAGTKDIENEIKK